VRRPIVAQNLGCVFGRVSRHADELNLLLHRCLVDHALDLGNPLGMQWANVRATRVDKVQDDNLAAEIGEPNSATVSVTQREGRRLLIDRLKELLLVAQHGLDLR